MPHQLEHAQFACDALNLSRLARIGSDAGARSDDQYMRRARRVPKAAARRFTHDDDATTLPKGLPFAMRRAASESARLAEGVGFEPTNGRPLPVFKTGAFNRSATLPIRRMGG